MFVDPVAQLQKNFGETPHQDGEAGIEDGKENQNRRDDRYPAMTRIRGAGFGSGHGWDLRMWYGMFQDL